jgi:tetratricopeptide (TPR) repeat protein
MAEGKRIKFYDFDESTNKLVARYLDEETTIQPIVYTHEQHIERARDFIAENNFFAAITELNAALDIGPETADIHYLRGVAFFGQNHLESAEEAFNRTREIDPQYYLASFQLARIHYDRSEFAQALQLYESIPHDVENYNLAKRKIGDCLIELERYDEAFDILDPSLLTPIEWFNLATQLYNTSDTSPETKLKYVNRALSLNDKNTVLLTMKGICLYKQNNYQEALQSFEAALTFQPKDKTILINKFLMKCYLGEHKESIEFIDKVIKHFPNDINDHLMKAEYLKIAGRKEEALKSCEYVIENLNKFSFDAWLFKKNLFDSKQEYEEVLRVLKKCQEVADIKNNNIEKRNRKTERLISDIQKEITTNLAKEMGFEFIYKILEYRNPQFLDIYTNWLITQYRFNNAKSICEENRNVEGFANRAKALLDTTNKVPKPMLSPFRDTKRKPEEVIDEDRKGPPSPPCKRARGIRLINRDQIENSPPSPYR